MFSSLRRALVGLAVIAASTVALPVATSVATASGVAPVASVQSGPLAQTVVSPMTTPTWSNTNIIAITAGNEHTCAIQGSSPAATTGSVFCWGKARSIGDGTANNSNVPVLVATNDGFTNTAVSMVEAGGDTTCAIEGGSLWCWGGVGGFGGQLGNGTTSSSPLPVKVSPNGSGAEQFFNNGNVTYVEASYAQTCAIESGKVFCWGWENDTLGLGGQSASPSSAYPNRVADSSTPGFRAASATSVHMGTNWVCAVAGGQVYCWGYDNYGNLGAGGNASSNRPRLVSNSSPGTEFTNASVSKVFIGADHGCAVVSGTLSCWGRGADGRLGSGGTTDQLLPTAVQAGGGFLNSASAVTSGAAAGNHSCAIESGRLYCWGLNTDGRLGNGSLTSSNLPVLVSQSSVPGFSNTGTGSGVVTAVTAGSSGGSNAHTCAIENKVAYCWGGFGSGQLGIGAPTGPGSNVPVKVFVTSAPAAPTISVSTGASGSLNVSVTKPNDGGSTITAYEYTIDNEATWTSVAFSNTNFQTITISGLTNGTQYSVKVRAVNAIGTGAASAASTGTPTAGGGGGGGGGSCTGGASTGTNNVFVSGTVGAAVNGSMPIISGTTSAMTYSLVTGSLPSGLSLNSQTGAITGTPQSTSFASVTVRATNGTQTCNFAVSISIMSPPCTAGAFTLTGSSPTLDLAWGSSGSVTVSNGGAYLNTIGMYPTTDNHVVVISGANGGARDGVDVRKFTLAGASVAGFGTGGRIFVEDASRSLSPDFATIDSSGKIYVMLGRNSVTPTTYHMIRLNGDGTHDTGFGTSGVLDLVGLPEWDQLQIAVSSSGEMYFATRLYGMPSTTYGLTKFTSSGIVNSFGVGGTINMAAIEGASVAVMADGSVLVGGSAQGQLKLAKYSSGGVADGSWGTAGVATFGNPSVSESAKVVTISGQNIFVTYVVMSPVQGQMMPSTAVGVAKLSLAGVVDTTFGVDGGVYTPIRSAYGEPTSTTVLADGTILVGVFQDTAIEFTSGFVRFSSTGQMDAAFQSANAVATHGTCGIMPPSIIDLGNGSVLFAGGKDRPNYAMRQEGVIAQLSFGAITPGTPGGGFTGGGNQQAPQNPNPSPNPSPAPVTPPSTTPPADDDDAPAPRVPGRPNLVTDENRPNLVRTPGQGGAVINGEDRPVQTEVIDSPAAQVRPERRTPAQVNQIRQAANDLVQQFTQQLPDGAPSTVQVVPTETGAIIRGLVTDANGNPIDVPAEDVVLMRAEDLVVMVGAQSANVTPDGRFQVPVGSTFGLAGTGFGGEEEGEFVVMSTPTLIAEFETTEVGTFDQTGTLPQSIGVGDHTLVVATGTMYAVLGIQVVPTTLPVTGSSNDVIVVFAMFTVVFGALLVRSRRTLLV